MEMKKHFVIFFSPGTLVAESDIKPIESWDVDAAIEMSRGIEARYGATPFGFQFITKERNEDELDSHVSECSVMYYLGGEVLTLTEIKERSDPRDSILISNMECNGWDRVIENRNSYLWCQPLKDGDVVLDYSPS
jgi:hypothetical protein